MDFNSGLQEAIDNLAASASNFVDNHTMPDFENMRKERLNRNKKAMEIFNKRIADGLVHIQQGACSRDETAAMCIQRYFRGYLGRRLYLQALLAKLEADEQAQRERMMEQLEEAELLVDNHRLEVLIDDKKTSHRNKQRKYISHIITLQRAWRVYLRLRKDTPKKATHTEMSESHDRRLANNVDINVTDSTNQITDESAVNKSVIQSNKSSNKFSDIVTEDCHHDNGQSRNSSYNKNKDRGYVDCIEGNTGKTRESTFISNGNSSNVIDVGNKVTSLNVVSRDSRSPMKNIVDAECESIHSDYSELAAPLRDLDLANSHRRGSLRKSPSPGDANVETEEEYAKRMKKINILSLAQEFADLKRVNTKALPFDLHRTLEDISPESDTSSQNTDSESAVASPEQSIMPVNNRCYEEDDGGRVNQSKDGVNGTRPQNGNVLGEDHDHVLSRLNNSNGNNGDAVENRRVAMIDKNVLESSLRSYTDNVVAKNMLQNNHVKLHHVDIDYEDNSTKCTLQNQHANGNIDHTVGSTANSSVIGNNKHRSADKNREVIDSNRKTRHGSGTDGKNGAHDASRRTKTAYNGSQMRPVVGKSPDKVDMPKNFTRIPKDALPPKNYDAVLTGQDFDVYNIETALPEMDWMSLETRLHQASEAEKQRSQARCNDREEIRKKLAMGPDDDVQNERAFAPRKSTLQSRLLGGPNLQICFMNDVEDAVPADPEPLVSLSESPQPSQPPQMNGKVAHKAKTVANGGSGISPCPPVNQSDDFLQQQAVLQAEAKLALAQAGTMARMQLEVEKQTTKRPPIAEKVGIPCTLVEDKEQRLTWRVLQMMNLAQTQIVVNDLHTQIQALNDELVRLLIERDDLHMEQDSMLVDVEDHTRRAKEISERVKLSQKQKKPGRRK